MDFNQSGSMGSNQQSQKLPKPKATWSYELHKNFVDLCHKQIEKRQGTFFPKAIWNKIIVDFNNQQGKDYDKKQMKNHWDSTKAEWKIWYKLKDYESGLGWDYAKNTITAIDEWWKDYIQACPDAHKFRFKGIDHAEKLTDLFLEGMATGKSAWAPSQGLLPNDSVGPCAMEENYDHEKIVDLDSDSQILSEKHRTIDLNDDVTDIENNKRKRGGKKKKGIPHSSEPRKRTSSAMTVNKHMDRICDVLETIVTRNKQEPKVSKTEVTIKDCINLLDQLEGVVKGSKLYLFACRLFLIKEQREMFEALDIDVRQAWLEDAENKPLNDL